MYDQTTVFLRRCLAPQASLRMSTERKTKKSSVASFIILLFCDCEPDYVTVLPLFFFVLLPLFVGKWGDWGAREKRKDREAISNRTTSEIMQWLIQHDLPRKSRCSSIESNSHIWLLCCYHTTYHYSSTIIHHFIYFIDVIVIILIINIIAGYHAFLRPSGGGVKVRDRMKAHEGNYQRLAFDRGKREEGRRKRAERLPPC